jgi:hypothetical protein
MITELIYQTEHVSIKVCQGWETMSCGGLDENIYISLFCNKTRLHSSYYNNEKIYFLL